jgi:predicted dehydrogenase
MRILLKTELQKSRFNEGSFIVSPHSNNDYNELLDRDDIDGVIIPSSWTSHAQIAIAAMKAGKYAGPEAGGASSLEECWELVKNFERNRDALYDAGERLLRPD